MRDREAFGFTREYIKAHQTPCYITGRPWTEDHQTTASHIDRTRGSGAKDELILPMAWWGVHQRYEGCMNNERRWLEAFPEWPFSRLRSAAKAFRLLVHTWAKEQGLLEGDS